MYDADPSLDILPPIATDSASEPDYITQWSLVPEKYFNSYSSESPSCSYLTTVPVWCYIAEKFLQKLDTYVDIMTKVSEGIYHLHIMQFFLCDTSNVKCLH